MLTVDGTTVTMPDTAANQQAYPQLAAQQPGCGFPIARMVVVFSLTVGTVINAAIGKYQGKQTGENSLFRMLYDSLRIGDLLLADRCYSGWFDIALLKQRGVDLIVRKHQLRKTDSRTGVRLGKHDHLTRWPKPQRPKWLSLEQYASLPNWLTLREIRVQVEQAGFRTKSLVIVTPLTDVAIDREELTTLYRRRWDAELNLRSLKSVMQMEHLRCKTSNRVRNEIFMHFAAYNLIRRFMAFAAWNAGQPPWSISFKGTLQTLTRLLPVLTKSNAVAWFDAFLTAIASHVVGNRPDRFEPRVKKRRPNSHKLMREPRTTYRKRILATR